MRRMLKMGRIAAIFALCMVIAMSGYAPCTVQAASTDVRVIVNGSEIDTARYGQAQIIGAGTTMVPFRGIFEALDLDVTYKTDANGTVTTVTAVSAARDVAIGLGIGEKELYKCTYTSYVASNKTLENSPIGTMTEAPFIDATGRTLIPLRAVAETLGAEVEWYSDTRTASITDSYSYRDAGGNYLGTDIPTYYSITGRECASYELDSDKDPVNHSAYHVEYYYERQSSEINAYFTALQRKGFVIDFFVNLKDSAIGLGEIILESPSNCYAHITYSSDEKTVKIGIYKINSYYYMSSISNDVPNYTYYTGVQCDSWKVSDTGKHNEYQYPCDEAKLAIYFEALAAEGFEYVYSSESGKTDYYGNDNGGYVGIFAGSNVLRISVFRHSDDYGDTDPWADNGGYYYNTDIPTYYEVTDKECTSYEVWEDVMPATGDQYVVTYTYPFTRGSMTDYSNALRSIDGFTVIETGDAIALLESPENCYIKIVWSEEAGICQIEVFATNPTYYMAETSDYVPNYTYYTGAKCTVRGEYDDYNIYLYDYDATELNTYMAALLDAGFVCADIEKGDEEVLYTYINGDGGEVDIFYDITDGTLGIIPYWLD